MIEGCGTNVLLVGDAVTRPAVVVRVGLFQLLTLDNQEMLEAEAHLVLVVVSLPRARPRELLH